MTTPATARASWPRSWAAAWRRGCSWKSARSGGLVYSIYASPNAFCDGGSMSIYAGTGREEIAELVPVLCDELNKVQDSFTADEVERTKRQLKPGWTARRRARCGGPSGRLTRSSTIAAPCRYPRP